MKIALCLYGKVGFTGGKADRRGQESEELLIQAYEKYKINLLDLHDVDVYFHSWSLSLEKKIIELYKPKKYLFEEQRNFSCKDAGERSFLYSRFYSAYKSAHLIQGNYDLAVMTRFDLDWRISDLSKIDPAKFNVSHYCGYGEAASQRDDFLWGKWRDKRNNFWEVEKLDHFHYDLETYGIFDHWFASSLSDLLLFSDMHLNMEEITKRAKRNSKNVMNPHLMILYHLRKTGLFEKINFTYHYLDSPLMRRSVFNSHS